MNERPQHPDFDGDDESLGGLLREVGSRDLPSAAVTGDVRQVVHAEWQAVVARRRRTRVVTYGLAASVAVAAVAVAIGLQLGVGSDAPVAQVARVDGALQIAVDGGEHWRDVHVGDTLTEGAMLRTDEGTRAALDFGDGLSVRVDAGSLVELTSPERIALDRGALYVDASPQIAPRSVAAQALTIQTLYGSVRHLGTQYELRTTRSGIEVSVREGRVEIENAQQKFTGNAGEQLLLAREGEPERRSVSPEDPRWLWATNIAPVFDIERQPLSEFLEWVARETGKQLVYATPEVRARAEQLILRGSVSNLPPEQAFAAVLATTPFTHLDTASEIRIQL
ncbi:MAG TPA: FecR family protein [Povalibacter sp.]